MVNFSLGSIPGYNAGVQAMSNAASYAGLTKTNDSGKSEWTGRAVGLASAGVAAGLATAIVVRYGADSSAILQGMQDDGAAALTGTKDLANWTAGSISSGVSSAYSAFTGAVGSAYEFVKPMPGQAAEGFQALGEEIKAEFNSLSNKVSEGFTSVGQQLTDIQSGINELLGKNTTTQ
jgi:hypothetical protein